MARGGDVVESQCVLLRATTLGEEHEGTAEVAVRTLLGRTIVDVGITITRVRRCPISTKCRA